MTGTLSLLAVRPTAALLKALGDENRLRILALLAPGELCVCHVADALELSQPNVSQHLTVLRHAGLVENERRGGWMYYRLVAQPADRAAVVDAVLACLPREGGDQARLQVSPQQRPSTSA